MFHSILIADRGEIACRVIRTCQRLAIHTVAVFSDPDAEARHVTLADEAVRVRAEMDGTSILAACRRTDAQAVHPGHGDLSESGAFARACAEAGVMFIGPPAQALEAIAAGLSPALPLTGTRHVEIPIFADQHGNIIHLFERDSSIRWPQQKLITEAPVLGLPGEMRARAGAAAIAAARTVGYVGAGTVEFLCDDAEIHLIAIRPQLQNEHPLTEMITGLDLVEWQLRIAAGQALPLRQEQVRIKGHAIAARLSAEGPALSDRARLHHLRLPEESPHLRIECGRREGDLIAPLQDPAIATLAVWDETRRGALRRLNYNLAKTQVAGVVTNLGISSAVAAHPAFIAGAIKTGFIMHYGTDLLPVPTPTPPDVLAVATLAVLLTDPHSPHNITFLDGDTRVPITARFENPGWHLILPKGRVIRARGESAGGHCLMTEIDGLRRRAVVVRQGQELTVLLDGGCWSLALET